MRSYALSITLALAACVEESTAPDDTGPVDSADAEASDEADLSGADDAEGPLLPAPPAVGTYDVGVIPAADSGDPCPSGSEWVQIHMDDEDTNNNNKTSGWIGDTTSDSNTTLSFCRVDGSKLKPLSTSNSSSKHYAVLRLGSSCPTGSTSFSRYIDNEDDDNDNWTEGTYSPNASADSYTRLYFCLFRYGSSAMSSFPSFGSGFDYGVFATSSFSKALDSGYAQSDDEDDGNNNSYTVSSTISADAKAIIASGSTYTKFWMSLVHDE